MNQNYHLEKLLAFLLFMGAGARPMHAESFFKEHKTSLQVVVFGLCAYGIYRALKHCHDNGYDVRGLPVDPMQGSAACAQTGILKDTKASKDTKTQENSDSIKPNFQSIDCLRQKGATCGYHALFNAGSWARYGKLCRQEDFDWLFKKRGSLPAENVGIGDLVQLRNKYCKDVQIFGKAPDGRWIVETRANGAISNLQKNKKEFSAVLHVPGHWIALKFSYEKGKDGKPMVTIADSNGGDYAQDSHLQEIAHLVFNKNHGLKVVENSGNLVSIGCGDAILQS